MLIKVLLVWCCIIPLAIINGFFREKILTLWLGSQYSLVVSGIILCCLIFILSYFCLPKIKEQQKSLPILIGITWMICTVLFEFILGLSMGHAFSDLLQAYDISSGNLWSLVVLTTGISPLLVHKLRK